MKDIPLDLLKQKLCSLNKKLHYEAEIPHNATCIDLDCNIHPYHSYIEKSCNKMVFSIKIPLSTLHYAKTLDPIIDNLYQQISNHLLNVFFRLLRTTPTQYEIEEVKELSQITHQITSSDYRAYIPHTLLHHIRNLYPLLPDTPFNTISSINAEFFNLPQHNDAIYLLPESNLF